MSATTEATLKDASARQRIGTDTRATLFVEAGAGSGKTSSLVNRLMTLVLEDDVPLARVAAVTFTEKAGAELRDRLREQLENARQEPNPLRQQRATQATVDLDASAIGTLHSFAQRILTMFPIQAGLPPLVEVLDEVASSVAFGARWSLIQRDLLGNPDLASHVLLALSTGIKLPQLRSLARAFGNDWDLIADRVLPHPPSPAALPDVRVLAVRANELAARRVECRDPQDVFLPKLLAVQTWAQLMTAATSDGERFDVLARGASLKWGHGKPRNWDNLAAIKSECSDFQTAVAQACRDFQEATLRPLAHWIAQQVESSARERMAEGRLEFHDLLVLSRNLLRQNADVRAALQEQFPRLLLDEFQDTDPIQIELALRIAAGADGGQADWHDIVVPPGSVFVVGDPKQSIYRFRRANITTYLDAQATIGERTTLSTNFRTVAPILDWVNATFANLIQFEDQAQPPYGPLDIFRDHTPDGPAVVVLGREPHDDQPNAQRLRELEAHDVAATISRALKDRWTVEDPTGHWRPLQLGDIAVLVPARTSLPFLEDAFERDGLPYRAESSSLVYQATEVRDLMAAARVLADPSDHLSCVTTLRSALFGCGDDDLWTWKRDGGSFNIFAPPDETRADHPVAMALGNLRRLANDARWMSPSEVLTALVVDRRMMEVAAYGSRARDQWRRLRFVIDQARAWADIERGSLREYLTWAAHQADETSRVAEPVLPETDLDVIRIMTVHAAKGLEFPMVVLSGMTAQPRNPTGVRLLWTQDAYAVRLSKQLQTNDFEAAQPVDEQMDRYERRRLLYVAATRARDHLVVSLHRSTKNVETSAKLFADAGAGTAASAVQLPTVALAQVRPSTLSLALPPPELAAWSNRIATARARTRYSPAQSASGLEGTEPEVALPGPPESPLPGDAKGPRDLELPPWSKGRYGDRIGRAVHGVLQVIDLATGAGLTSVAAAQATAEGVVEHTDAVAALAASALASPLIQRAAMREFWRESYVGTALPDGTTLEGFVDLIFREDDGTLVIIDYKTDTVPDAALPARIRHYTPQIRAYQRALTAATGAEVTGQLLFLRLDERDAQAAPVIC